MWWYMMLLVIFQLLDVADAILLCLPSPRCFNHYCKLYSVCTSIKTLLNRPKGLQSNQSESKRAMMNLRAAVSIFILLGMHFVCLFYLVAG